MTFNPSEDIRSVTDLKRNTKEILSQVHRTKRPVVLTVNGKADAVLMDTKTYEKYLTASNMARLLARAEEDIGAGRTRPIRSFLKAFKRANRRQSGLRLARHSWRKTSRHFNVLGLENRNPHNAE